MQLEQHEKWSLKSLVLAVAGSLSRWYPSVHSPCPWQSEGQGATVEQSMPPYPGAQTHRPPSHTPRPEQSAGHDVAPICTEQSVPVKPASQKKGLRTRTGRTHGGE